MHVDYLTLACLRDRLDGLLGARVQRVLLVDDLSVGLEIYARQRFQLLISAHPQHSRMLLVPHKLRRGVETETPLLQLLRKWVRNARLVDVTQPAWERILKLHFDGQAGPCCLIAELIGRYSNLILTGPDGGVLDAAKRIGPDLNRYRVTLPGQPYQPPPVPAAHRPPVEVTADEWATTMAAAPPDKQLHRLLTRRLLGVSPILAREIVARATGLALGLPRGDPEATVRAVRPTAVVTTIEELFSPVEARDGRGSWSPHVAMDENGNVIAFAPYELHQFEQIEPAADISDAMWRYFQQKLLGDPYATARHQVQVLIGRARSRIERTLEQLQAQVVDDAEIDSLREAGELLLTYQGQVTRGAREITVPDHAGDPRTIPLDPTLKPVENAQAYFRRYRKAARAAKEVSSRVAALTPDLAYLSQLAADLALAESRPEIDAVRGALVEAGWAPKPRQSTRGQSGGPRRLELGEFMVYVGRNARQNEEITFKRAAPDDLWLHVRGQPGAHVIVKTNGRAVPEDVIQQAAALAAHHSPARGENQVGVDVTERRFVRRLRGGRPGLVTYRNERTIWVDAARDPQQEEERPETA
jgi:predicted ribosome quality control (RQC) complex YloA/Tae2 family protein